MPVSDNFWPEVALALQSVLSDNLQALLDETNAYKFPDAPIELPVEGVQLGITSELIHAQSAELPAVAVGVYERVPLSSTEGEATQIGYPVILEAYLCHTDRSILLKQAIKWAVLFDTYLRQYIDSISEAAGEGLFVIDEGPARGPRADVTMLLKKRDGYRQLVTVVATLRTYE